MPLLDPAFLGPLAQSNSDTVARILADLYAESRRARQPLDRNTALDLIITHTRTAATADDPLPDARAMLAALQAGGWLTTEIQPDGQQAVALTPSAFQFLRAAQTRPPSVAELLVAVHDLLKAALLDVDNEARLTAAANLCDQLIDQLKSFQHAPAESDPLPDTARLRLAALEAASKLETRGHAPAGRIREQLAALDPLLADIADRRARLARPESPPSAIAPQLAGLIEQLAALDKKAFAARAAELIHIYQQRAPGSQSAAENRQPGEPFVPAEWPLPSISQADLEAARRAVRRQFNRPITPDRVRRLARQFIEDRAGAQASELVREGRADLPLVVQFRLHGESNLGYSLEEGQWAEINGLVFRDFFIRNPYFVSPATLEESPAGESNTASAPVSDTGT